MKQQYATRKNQQRTLAQEMENAGGLFVRNLAHDGAVALSYVDLLPAQIRASAINVGIARSAVTKNAEDWLDNR